MKYLFLLLLIFSSSAFSLQEGLEVGCESEYHNQPIEESICDRKVFISPEKARKYFGGYIVKYRNPNDHQEGSFDLNGDGVDEILLEIHNGRRSNWIVLLYENSSYRAISNFSGTELMIGKLPSVVANQLSINSVKFKGYKYIQVTNPITQASADHSFYAFNGHRYNYLGGWSWDGMGILSKEDFE